MAKEVRFLSDMKAPDEENPAQKPVKKYQVNEIKPEHFFSAPVYLDKQFILTAPEMRFTGEMIKALDEWKFKEVYSTGSPVDEYTAQTTEKTKSGGVSRISSRDDAEKLWRAKKFYADFLSYVETVFTQAEETNKLDYNSIVEEMKTICETVKEDRRFILRIERPSPSGENYLASHAAKSTIISIVIGLQLKMPSHRLIELGVSALLHEIGMTRLPEETYLSGRPLESEERKAILTHPILGYNLLKASEFPTTITTPVLEHHERENGEGYPRKLTGERISLNAKIIAVACSYEAISAHRPHKEAKDGFTGMTELLKNSGKQYDDAVIRALVFSLSLYPIGIYVLLSNGGKGQVVDVNPENPRFPVVQIFGEFTTDGKTRTIETSQDGINIVRPLTKEETGGTN
jgi:HD-GYP domain-containing protein (c-di-GMP phosphodiesterase class II)